MRKKSGNIFTKFEENFGESLNLVNKSSDKTFTKFGETEYCDNLFTKFGVILINIFGDLFSEEKSGNIFTKCCENFGESPNFVKNPVFHQI